MRPLSIVAVLAGAKLAASAPTYLALGDSVAFGYQDGDLVPNFGVQGYVDDVAAALDAKTGVPHSVLNLAVPQETSASFANTDVFLGRLLNLNYGGQQVSQESLLVTNVNAIKAGSGTVDAVSFAIGANDLLNMTNLGTTLPTSMQIDSAKAAIYARYAAVLAYLKTEFPNALYILPGYYLPVDPASQQGAALLPILTDFNTGLQTLALANGARYVDFYGAISGHETDWILPGIHPNAVGYDALGRAAAQAVPEPSALAAIGLAGLCAVRRKFRSTSSRFRHA